MVRRRISRRRHADHGRADDPVGTSARSLLWANLSNGYVWIVLGVTLGFGAIGFYDDYLKVTKQSHLGFSGKARLGLEIRHRGIAAWAIMQVLGGALRPRPR
jgi:UDP-N-acetylmuramyl pentapeptide phosphotransferase/UDP-N-acetylglucosamine-1-phosphate transferase